MLDAQLNIEEASRTALSHHVLRAITKEQTSSILINLFAEIHAFSFGTSLLQKVAMIMPELLKRWLSPNLIVKVTSMNQFASYLSV